MINQMGVNRKREKIEEQGELVGNTLLSYLVHLIINTPRYSIRGNGIIKKERIGNRGIYSSWQTGAFRERVYGKSA